MGNSLMRMQWRHLLFMHWPVAVDVLRPLIPPQLQIDEFEGTAWVGLIPFTMRDVLPRLAPKWRGLCDVPRFSAFHECNVRTYVYPRDSPNERGVWFFSLDAHSRSGVWAARKFFHLPYFYSRIGLQCSGDEVHYSVDRIDVPRATMRCAWRIGRHLQPSAVGDIAHFLTERYMLYAANSRGDLFRSRIAHVQWPLRCAELISLTDELVRSAGIQIDQTQPPLLHYADALDVLAWKLERVVVSE